MLYMCTRKTWRSPWVGEVLNLHCSPSVVGSLSRRNMYALHRFFYLALLMDSTVVCQKINNCINGTKSLTNYLFILSSKVLFHAMGRLMQMDLVTCWVTCMVDCLCFFWKDRSWWMITLKSKISNWNFLERQVCNSVCVCLRKVSFLILQ